MGIESLDVHHRHVWRRLGHVAAAASEGRTLDVRAALRFLHVYLAEHYADEERWMEDAGYPGAGEHARAHAGILARIRAAREAEERLSPKALFEAADALAGALEAHMRVDDVKLGRFWAMRENLRRLAGGASPPPISVPLASPWRERAAEHDEHAVEREPDGAARRTGGGAR